MASPPGRRRSVPCRCGQRVDGWQMPEEATRPSSPRTPKLVPARGIEAQERAKPSQRIHLAVLDNRCRNRAEFLFRVEGPVVVPGVIPVGPKRLAGRLVKTVDALLRL